jgi:hypothetical protein
MDSVAPTKQCAYCKAIKPTSAFGRHTSRKDGLNSRCRDCVNARRRHEIPKLPVHPARFWEKVDASGDCWEWTAGRNVGYGVYGVNRRPRLAHRVAWELLVGPIAAGVELDHLCRNRACVNPDHLEPVNHAENCRRGYSPAAQNQRKTHCPQGHPYSGDNLFYNNRGQRCCRECP